MRFEERVFSGGPHSQHTAGGVPASDSSTWLHSTGIVNTGRSKINTSVQVEKGLWQWTVTGGFRGTSDDPTVHASH